MRKSFIGWWVASAWCFFGCIKFIYDIFFFPDSTNSAGVSVLAIAAVLAGLFFFIGYRRFQEYQEYQEDRRIKNEFYQSNTKKENENSKN